MGMGLDYLTGCECFRPIGMAVDLGLSAWLANLANASAWLGMWEWLDWVNIPLLLDTIWSSFLSKLLDILGVFGVLSLDPNEKIGPAGAGPQRVVETVDELYYTVYFENVVTATAPAQVVTVVDQLDPHLDWSSFQPTEVAFGDKVVPLSGETYQFAAQQSVSDYREGEGKQWWVDIAGEINPLSGRAEWTLRTLDPETGELPEDPLAGFLPPNDEGGRGEGHVSFSIRPWSDVVAGTYVSNSATIVFDSNEAIETNHVWNTIGAPIELSGGASEAADPGAVVSYTHILTNTGQNKETLEIGVNPPDGWAFDLIGGQYPNGTLELPLTVSPDTTATFDVSLTVPVDVLSGTYTTVVTAGSRAGDAVYDVVTNTITVITHPKIYLPLVVRNR
jgi:hypothetical protein